MENEKYLNEEKYQAANKKVRSIGKIFLIIGIVLLVISVIVFIFGFLGFGNNAVSSIGNKSIDSSSMQRTASGMFGSFGLITIGAFASSIGFMLAAVGGIAMVTSHRREIVAYTAQQAMPIAQEGIEKITPTVAKSAGEIAKSVKQGLNDADEK